MRTKTRAEMERMLDFLEQQIQIPQDAEERFIHGLSNIFADARAGLLFNEALDAIERDIEIPAAIEDRSIARFGGRLVAPTHPSEPPMSEPPISGPPASLEMHSQPWSSEEAPAPTTGVPSRS